MSQDLSNRPHRRWNPLTGQYVLVCPGRTQRPWQGRVEAVAQARRPAHADGAAGLHAAEGGGGHGRPAAARHQIEAA